MFYNFEAPLDGHLSHPVSVLTLPRGFLADPSPLVPSPRGGHGDHGFADKTRCKTWQLNRPNRLSLDAWTFPFKKKKNFCLHLKKSLTTNRRTGIVGLFPWVFAWKKKTYGFWRIPKRCRRCSLHHWQCGDVAPAQLWGTGEAPAAGCRWISSGWEA